MENGACILTHTFTGGVSYIDKLIVDYVLGQKTNGWTIIYRLLIQWKALLLLLVQWRSERKSISQMWRWISGLYTRPFTITWVVHDRSVIKKKKKAQKLLPPKTNIFPVENVVSYDNPQYGSPNRREEEKDHTNRSKINSWRFYGQ